MAIMLNGISSNRTSSLYSITQQLINSSTSVDSKLYSALQNIKSSSDSTEEVQSAYKDVDTYLKSYQSDLYALQDAASDLLKTNKDNVFSKYQAGEADLDDIASAVEKFVDSYNSVTSLLQDNEERGTGTASHAKAFSRGLADEKILNRLGITYNKEGKMELDKDTLKEALGKEFDVVASILGDQYGIADRAMMKADHALSDSVSRIVNNDLTTLAGNTQNFSSIQYTNNFAKAGPYNLSNMYMVGLFFNTTV